ncbi:uncharacterized protein F5147DRAFT_710461, partial [Suillus discolor]
MTIMPFAIFIAASFSGDSSLCLARRIRNGSLPFLTRVSRLATRYTVVIHSVGIFSFVSGIHGSLCARDGVPYLLAKSLPSVSYRDKRGQL